MSHYGKIVNVSSIAGRSKSLVSGVHYTSSKAGIIGLTRQLAQELGLKGILLSKSFSCSSVIDLFNIGVKV